LSMVEKSEGKRRGETHHFRPTCKEWISKVGGGGTRTDKEHLTRIPKGSRFKRNNDLKKGEGANELFGHERLKKKKKLFPS